MWRHKTADRTYGNVLAKIYQNGLNNMELGVWFEYVAQGGATSDESWFINVLEMIAGYFGIPMPNHIDHFQTFVKTYI